MKCLNTRNFRVYATRSLKLPLVGDLQEVDMMKPKVIITVKINRNRFPKVPDFDRTKNYHNKELKGMVHTYLNAIYGMSLHDNFAFSTDVLR